MPVGLVGDTLAKDPQPKNGCCASRGAHFTHAVTLLGLPSVGSDDGMPVVDRRLLPSNARAVFATPNGPVVKETEVPCET